MKRGCLIAACTVLACGSPPAPSEPPPPVTLTAMRAAAPHIDGELEDPGWDGAEISARFVDAITGETITPYTEVRAMWDDDALTLAIYGADEDVVSTDRMGAVLRTPNGDTFVIEIDPAGGIRWHAPAAAPGTLPEGVLAAVDADATLDQDDLEDEEWIAEVRVPWRALGLDRPADLRVNFFRRDRPRGSLPLSLAWTPWRDQPSAAIPTLGLLRCVAAPEIATH